MIYSTQGKNIGPGQFLKKRIIRIAPTYWLCTGLLLVILVSVPSAFNEMGFELPRVIASFAFLSEFLFRESPSLYVGWTLEYEMYFYVCFAVCLTVPPGGWLVGCFAWYDFDRPFASKFGIVYEFLLGVGLRFINQRWRDVPHLGMLFLILGAGALLLSLPFHFDDLSWRALFWGLPACLLVLDGLWSRPHSSKPLNLLGDASYSIT